MAQLYRQCPIFETDSKGNQSVCTVCAGFGYAKVGIDCAEAIDLVEMKVHLQAVIDKQTSWEETRYRIGRLASLLGVEERYLLNVFRFVS